ncbi:RHS repeat-associated core domain-containing protein [Streptomyces sp. NPDC008343]|uniref:RHS repeat-associated core domain-containing protein n=1 Tax=Streptomyces sp. NPDC008343 TaxID=3364828 RepID=UPI0036ED948D
MTATAVLSALLPAPQALADPSPPANQVTDDECKLDMASSVWSYENCAPGGQEGVGPATVNPSTGKLSMELPLGAVGGDVNPAFALGLRYDNSLVDEQVATWNYEAPTKFSGLGWSVPAAEARIERIDTDSGAAWDDRFRWVRPDGTSALLTLTGRNDDGTTKYYSAGGDDFTKIVHNSTDGVWTLTDTSGVEYLYGDGGYRSSDTASTATRNALVCNSVSGFTATDACVSGATEYGVRWKTWVGPSFRTVGQEQYETAWGLAAIQGLNGKRTTLYYAQHTQSVSSKFSSNPNRTADPQTYTKARYLYQVRSDNGDELQLSWLGKTKREAPDPHTENEEPDAYQERLTVLYLDAVTKNRKTGSGTIGESKQQLYHTMMNDTSDNQSPAYYMGKRVLTTLTPSLYQQDGTWVGTPPYIFTYGGQSTKDDVSVSRYSQDDLYNSTTGAIYGMLSTVTTPEGTATTYTYQLSQRSGSPKIGYQVTSTDSGLTANRHVQWGPGYVLVSGDSGSKHRVILYAWTTRGWTKAWQQDSTGYFDGEDANNNSVGFDVSKGRWAAVGDGLVAVLLPTSANVAGVTSNCNKLSVVARDADDANTWSQVSSITQIVCGATSVAVGKGIVAVAGATTDTGNQKWYMWRNSAGDWSDTNNIETKNQSFSTTMSGQLPTVAAQVGAGFVSFSLTNRSDSEKSWLTQKVNTDFVFVTDEGVQSSVVSKATTVPRKMDSFTWKGLTCNTYAYISEISTGGANPNLMITMERDADAISTCGVTVGSGTVWWNKYTLDNSEQDLAWAFVVRGRFTNSADSIPTSADSIVWDSAVPSDSDIGSATSVNPGATKSMTPGVLSSDVAVFTASTFAASYVGETQKCYLVSGCEVLSLQTIWGADAYCAFGAVTPAGLSSKTAPTASNCFYGNQSSLNGYSQSALVPLDSDFVVTRTSSGAPMYWRYDPNTETMSNSGTSSDEWNSVVHDTTESQDSNGSGIVEGGFLDYFNPWLSYTISLDSQYYGSPTDSSATAANKQELRRLSSVADGTIGADASGSAGWGSYDGNSRYVVNGTGLRYRQANGNLDSSVSWTSATAISGSTGMADSYIPYTVTTGPGSAAGIAPLRNGAARTNGSSANITLAGTSMTYASTEQATDVDDLTSDAGLVVYDSSGSGRNFADAVGTFWLVSTAGDILEYDTDNSVAMTETAEDLTVSSVSFDDGNTVQTRTYSYSNPEGALDGQGLVYGSTTVTLGSDGSAGTVTYSAYANQGATSRNVYEEAPVDGGVAQAGLPLVDFPSDRTATSWTSHRNRLQGQVYQRAETGVEGSGTDAGSVSKVAYYTEIARLPQPSAYGHAQRRSIDRVFSSTSTQDGVDATTTTYYNGLGQPRSVQRTTTTLKTSANAAGTISTSTNSQQDTTTTYYAWEVAEYRTGMLADNRTDAPYLTYSERSSGGKAPDVTSATVQTYSTPSDTSVLMPDTAYQARGDEISAIRPVVSLAGMVAESGGNAGAWLCASVTDTNWTVEREDACPRGNPGTSLFIPHRIAGNPSKTSADQYAPVTWILESVTTPGYCVDWTENRYGDITYTYQLAVCDMADEGQVMGITESRISDIGYLTTLKRWDSNGETCMSGWDSDGAGSMFEGWGSCSRTANTSVDNEVLRIVPYPEIQLQLRSGSPGGGTPGCAFTDNTVYEDVTVLNGMPTKYNYECLDKKSLTLFVVHDDGGLESANYRGSCINRDLHVLACSETLLDENDATFVPHMTSTDYNGYSTLQLNGQCWLWWNVGITGQCYDTGTVYGVYPDPAENSTNGAAQGLPTPSMVTDDPDVWVKTGAVTKWDATTLLPITTQTYAGSSGSSRRATDSTTVYSGDGRGLALASFTGADTSQAGYLGFEAYEVTSSSGTTCATVLPSGWNCNGMYSQAVSVTASGHVGSALIMGGASQQVSLYADSFTAPADAQGKGTPYVFSAWVQGKCSIAAYSTEDETKVTEPQQYSAWEYVELPFSTTAGATLTPSVACYPGAKIDDIRFGPANGEFAAVVYDPANGYLPLAQLDDAGLTTKVAYGPAAAQPLPYIERIDATTHQVTSQSAAGFVMGGFSRFAGSASNTSSSSIFRRSLPNVMTGVQFGADTARFCPTLNASGSTFCSGSSLSVPGASFAARMQVSNSTSTSAIDVAWTPSGGSALQAGFYPAESQFAVKKYTNGKWNVVTALSETRRPKELAVVAYSDFVVVIADAKIVLVSPNTTELTATPNPATSTTVTFASPSLVTNVLVGSAPQVSVDYLDGQLRGIESHQLMTAYSDGTPSLVDTVITNAYDNWGRQAVTTLPISYETGNEVSEAATAGDKILSYRSAMGVFTWKTGKLNSDSAVYKFYDSGDGTDYITHSDDPAQALTYDSTTAEPAGRPGESAGAGAALGLDSDKTTTASYQDWSSANLATELNADSATESEMVTSTEATTVGSGQTVVSQSVSDLTGANSIGRLSWKNSGDTSWSDLTRANNTSYNSTTSTKPAGVTSVSTISEIMAPNYFAGAKVSSPTSFVKRQGAVDLVGQWTYSQEPDISGASHVFRDDEGKVRFTLSTTGINASDSSDGAMYYVYDQLGRLTEIDALYNVHKSSLSDYAAAARLDSDPDIAGKTCPLIKYSYDTDPTSGAPTGYGYQRGQLTKATVYVSTSMTSTRKLTSCPDRKTNTVSYAYDDLGRPTYTYETHGSTGNGRTTKTAYSYGGLVTTLTYPDQNTSTAMATTAGQTSVTYWADMMGQPVRLEAGTTYPTSDTNTWWKILDSDWAGRITQAQRGDGYTETYSYDLRGNLTDKRLKNTSGTILAGEQLLFMRPETGSGSASPACGGTASADASNAREGQLLGRKLYGDHLSERDRDIWSCYSYDGAGRLTDSGRYDWDGDSWNGMHDWTTTTSNTFDANSNVTGRGRGATNLDPSTGDTTIAVDSTATFTRSSGTNKLVHGSLRPTDTSGSTTTIDATHNSDGNLTKIKNTTSAKHEIEFYYDAFTGRVATQAARTGNPTVNEAIAYINYTPQGLRATRYVNGTTTYTNEYWYGTSSLQPLVVTNDLHGDGASATSRLIIYTPGGNVTGTQTKTTSGNHNAYPFTDHTGSTLLLKSGATTNYLTQYSYSDWGVTAASTTDSTDLTEETDISPSQSDFEIGGFQGQEQDTFSVSTTSLATWLDQISLYHYPYREYLAGLAQFTSPDPARSSDSPYAAFAGDPINNIDPDGLMVANLAAIAYKQAYQIGATRPSFSRGVWMERLIKPFREQTVVFAAGFTVTSIVWTIVTTYFHPELVGTTFSYLFPAAIDLAFDIVLRLMSLVGARSGIIDMDPWLDRLYQGTPTFATQMRMRTAYTGRMLLAGTVATVAFGLMMQAYKEFIGVSNIHQLNLLVSASAVMVVRSAGTLLASIPVLQGVNDAAAYTLTRKPDFWSMFDLGYALGYAVKFGVRVAMVLGPMQWWMTATPMYASFIGWAMYFPNTIIDNLLLPMMMEGDFWAGVGSFGFAVFATVCYYPLARANRWLVPNRVPLSF